MLFAVVTTSVPSVVCSAEVSDSDGKPAKSLGQTESEDDAAAAVKAVGKPEKAWVQVPEHSVLAVLPLPASSVV